MSTLTRLSNHKAQTSLNRSRLRLPLYASTVPAGFASPADDYLEGSLDLNEYLISHPAATYYCRVSGQSMQGLGILDGCLLVVDRALEARHGDIVVAVINGEMTCKELDTHRQRLLSGNIDYPPIPIPDEADCMIEGVVIHAINSYVSPR